MMFFNRVVILVVFLATLVKGDASHCVCYNGESTYCDYIINCIADGNTCIGSC